MLKPAEPEIRSLYLPEKSCDSPKLEKQNFKNTII